MLVVQRERGADSFPPPPTLLLTTLGDLNAHVEIPPACWPVGDLTWSVAPPSATPFHGHALLGRAIAHRCGPERPPPDRCLRGPVYSLAPPPQQSSTSPLASSPARGLWVGADSILLHHCHHLFSPLSSWQRTAVVQPPGHPRCARTRPAEPGGGKPRVHADRAHETHDRQPRAGRGAARRSQQRARPFHSPQAPRSHCTSSSSPNPSSPPAATGFATGEDSHALAAAPARLAGPADSALPAGGLEARCARPRASLPRAHGAHLRGHSGTRPGAAPPPLSWPHS